MKVRVPTGVALRTRERMDRTMTKAKVTTERRTTTSMRTRS